MNVNPLLLGSISLMGFISTFIIFAYNIINNYKETRRGILRTYINHLFDLHVIPKDHYIRMLIEIQNIGRVKDLTALTEQARQDGMDISPFVRDIEAFNRKRRTMTYLGLGYLLGCVVYYASFKVSLAPFNRIPLKTCGFLAEFFFGALIVSAFAFVLWSLLVGVNDKKIEYPTS